MEHSEKNIDDNENFLHRHKACVDWLTKAQQQLDSCSDMVGDEDSLNVKLAIIAVGAQLWCVVQVQHCGQLCVVLVQCWSTPCSDVANPLSLGHRSNT